MSTDEPEWYKKVKDNVLDFELAKAEFFNGSESQALRILQILEKNNF